MTLLPLIVLTFILTLNTIKSEIISLEPARLSGQDPHQLQQFKKPKQPVDWLFDDFKKHFTKFYALAQEENDSSIAFKQNIQKLKKTKCSPCGVTSLFDKNQDQIDGLKGLLPGKGDTNKNNHNTVKKRLLQTLGSTVLVPPPLNFDWRKFNTVTSVKNQKDCGVCWAFTVTAFFESELIRRNQSNLLIDLAQQFLYQCDNASYGCQGGYLNTAMELVLERGFPRQFFWLYNTQKNYSGICLRADSNIKLNGVSDVVGYFSKNFRLSDEQIIQLLLQRPVMIGVYADDWIFYMPTQTDRTMKCRLPGSGLYGAVINHAVLLVGFTQTEWIVKNSWGSLWGVNGYIYISRNLALNCGVGHYLYTLDYPLLPPNF